MMVTSDVTGISQVTDLQITFNDAHMYMTVSTNCKRETATVLINAGKQKNNKQNI